MKAKIVGKIRVEEDGSYSLPIVHDAGIHRGEVRLSLDLSDEQVSQQRIASINLSINSSWWLFRDTVVEARGFPALSPDDRADLDLRIKHLVLKAERALARIRKEVEAFENLEKLPSARRERIPESVRIFVWQRDQGKCVKCGSREKLEFDHVIPVADGGANTERNVQLLCEPCNRAKGRAVS